MFRYLLENAIEAADPQDPRVTVSSGPSRAPDFVRIAIHNTGEPPQAQDLEDILSPFHSSKPMGTGLGLPIASLARAAQSGQPQPGARAPGWGNVLREPARATRELGRNPNEAARTVPILGEWWLTRPPRSKLGEPLVNNFQQNAGRPRFIARELIVKRVLKEGKNGRGGNRGLGREPAHGDKFAQGRFSLSMPSFLRDSLASTVRVYANPHSSYLKIGKVVNNVLANNT